MKQCFMHKCYANIRPSHPALVMWQYPHHSMRLLNSLKLVLGLSVSVTCLLYSCKMFVRSLQLLLFLISKVTLEETILSNRKYHYKTITCVTNDADLTDSSNIDFATECINKCKFSSDVSIVTIIEEAARVKRYLFSMR